MLDTLGEARQGYIGKEKDVETMLGDHGVRKYDYETGRFNSPDPLWEKFQGWTPYQYCGNNPVWSKDWNGMKFNINSQTPEYMKKAALVYIDQAICYFEENGDKEAADFIRGMQDDPENVY